MKKVLIILVLIISHLLITSHNLIAQKYYKLVDTNKLWSIQQIMVAHPTKVSWYNIKFTKDTTIKGIVYRKVMLLSDTLHLKLIDGYIRETADEKVYYLGQKSNIDTVEFCLYNFNLKKGDTVFSGYSMIVDSINNISVGKQLRKRFYLSENYYKEIWIEGIGSLCGLLNVNRCSWSGGESALLCFTENDTLKYINPEYNHCPQVIDNVNVNELRMENGELRIYPNPAHSLLVVSYSLFEKTNVSLNIYDLIGNQVLSLVNQEQPKGENKIEFNTEKLNNGIYFCKLQAGNSSMTKKIVVMH